MGKTFAFRTKKAELKTLPSRASTCQTIELS